MLFRASRWLLNTLFKLLTRRSIEGIENLPLRGPCIVVMNHLSYVDGPLIFALVPAPLMTGWAAEKYARHILVGPLIRLYGGIFIRRGEVDREALSLAVSNIRRGYVFGMSPEGTRSKTGALSRGKTGAAYLAHLADAPIVPVGIAGTDRVVKTLLRLRRARISVRVGEPFHLPPVREEHRAADLRRNTDEIMCHIAALLPAEYRGVYAEHPRLKELLEQSKNRNQGSGIRD